MAANFIQYMSQLCEQEAKKCLMVYSKCEWGSCLSICKLYIGSHRVSDCRLPKVLMGH